ncbi:MAG TPA: glycoside hydrolase family 38 C-terminal domain-containing protein [Clostridiales bacterium]|nr:glycoside hydrolase family 38 C-terminal domain-containing protein [Clostridiales bacterium]
MSIMRKKILLNKINQLKNCIYASFENLDNWETRIGVFKAAGNNEITNEQWENIAIGTRWEAKDDIVRWFRRNITIPSDFQGKKVILDIEVGGEGLVYINGEMKSAITSYIEPWAATRTRVLLTPAAKGNESLDVLIEAGLNYMEFADYRRKGMESVQYEFRSAKLRQIDTKVEKYYFDAIVTYEVIEVLEGKGSERLPRNIKEMITSLVGFDKYGTLIHAKLVDALESSLLTLDFDFSRERLLASIDEAECILNEKLNEIPHFPQGQVILTGHSHIDTAWLWPIKETIKKCSRTFSNTIALMDEFPEHNFAQSQPQLYEYTKKYYPELYKKIREKVKGGKWELIGNSWVECDTNVPSGESLVRQILYGRNFFKDEFGKWSDIFWMPDVFGYSWALPQIIKRSGMEFFYTAKLNNNDVNRFPYSLFWWQGIDGTRVISYLQRATYNGEINPSFINELWTNYDEKELHSEVLGTYGFGDGGGGPTYEMLEYSKRLMNFPGMPATKIDSAYSFFENVKLHSCNLPVWNDEMYYEFHRGTYTSQAHTKRNNRKSELLYRQSEIASSIALNKFNNEYSIEQLTEGWKLILLNQFHDIIPGSSINEVYRDCAVDYKKIFAIGSDIEDKSLQAIISNVNFDYMNENTEKISIENAGIIEEEALYSYIVVFNYLSWPVTGPVEAVISINNSKGYTFESLALEDIKGDKIPCTFKKIDEQTVAVSFEALDVPSMGYTSYKLVKVDEEMQVGKTIDNSTFDHIKRITVTKELMENQFFKINVDNNGTICSIFDKKAGREVLSEGGHGNVLQIFEDRPARESAWNIDIEYQKKSWVINEVKFVEVKEVSETKGVLRVVKAFNKSEIVQDITIYASTPRIDFYTHVNWQETEKLLKAAFEVEILSPCATYEIAFGSIRRPTHWNTSWDQAKFEVPAHKWADLSEGGYGVSILNDCKYGYDIKDNEMRITLLKAPVYPDPVADKGTHEFVYSLYPHIGDWINGNVVNAGYELNVPLKAICINKDKNDQKSASQGVKNAKASLPPVASFVQIDKVNVIIDTLKAAEDGDGLIMRLYESSGRRGKVKISTELDITNVTECNLMEEDEGRIDFKNGELCIDIKPYEIKTLRLRKS